MTDTSVDGKVQRIQAMLYAKTSHEPETRFQRLYGYKSQRQKGDVHDLETHHVDPNGDNSVDNLRTVCLPCHHRLTAIQQAD